MSQDPPIRSTSVVDRPDEKTIPQYVHTPEERKFIADVWSEFRLMWMAKQTSLELLDGRNLQAFWDDSNRDYGVITQSPEDTNDPVTQYVSSISRDKADVFISNLTSEVYYPSVVAVNKQKEIDRILSRTGQALMEWAYYLDGYPSESGHQKICRYVHKSVVEGTCHVLDHIYPDGMLESFLVPNEEVFVPNFWQPDIQKQKMVIRAQLNITYEEFIQMFGELENSKYVRPGFTDWWFVQRPEFKSQWEGIVYQRRIQLLFVWIKATPMQLKDLKEAGRVPKKAKSAYYYNIIVNDVPMFPVDNLSPYKNGMLPMNKLIFSLFNKPEFYWGNSAPNKIRKDKVFLDNWKTLLRYKGKLNVLKPMVSLNGNFVDEEILLPAKVTPITDDLDLKVIEGVGDPVTQADVMLLDMAEKEIDRGSVSPTVAGQATSKRQTARETVLQASGAQKALDSFTNQIVFFAMSRSAHILTSQFQFISRNLIEKIVIPDRKLSDGTRGSFEIMFKKLPKQTEAEKLETSFRIRESQAQAKRDNNNKEIFYIDPSYIEDIHLYLRPEAATGSQSKDVLKQQNFMLNAEKMYLLRPDLFDQKEVARQIVQVNEDDDSILLEGSPNQKAQEQMMAMQQATEAGKGPLPQQNPKEGPMAALPDKTKLPPMGELAM